MAWVAHMRYRWLFAVVGIAALVLPLFVIVPAWRRSTVSESRGEQGVFLDTLSKPNEDIGVVEDDGVVVDAEGDDEEEVDGNAVRDVAGKSRFELSWEGEEEPDVFKSRKLVRQGKGVGVGLSTLCTALLPVESGLIRGNEEVKDGKSDAVEREQLDSVWRCTGEEWIKADSPPFPLACPLFSLRTLHTDVCGAVAWKDTRAAQLEKGRLGGCGVGEELEALGRRMGGFKENEDEKKDKGGGELVEVVVGIGPEKKERWKGLEEVVGMLREQLGVGGDEGGKGLEKVVEAVGKEGWGKAIGNKWEVRPHVGMIQEKVDALPHHVRVGRVWIVVEDETWGGGQGESDMLSRSRLPALLRLLSQRHLCPLVFLKRSTLSQAAVQSFLSSFDIILSTDPPTSSSTTPSSLPNAITRHLPRVGVVQSRCAGVGGDADCGAAGVGERTVTRFVHLHKTGGTTMSQLASDFGLHIAPYNGNGDSGKMNGPLPVTCSAVGKDADKFNFVAVESVSESPLCGSPTTHKRRLQGEGEMGEGVGRAEVEMVHSVSSSSSSSASSSSSSSSSSSASSSSSSSASTTLRRRLPSDEKAYRYAVAVRDPVGRLESHMRQAGFNEALLFGDLQLGVYWGRFIDSWQTRRLLGVATTALPSGEIDDVHVERAKHLIRSRYCAAFPTERLSQNLPYFARELGWPHALDKSKVNKEERVKVRIRPDRTEFPAAPFQDTSHIAQSIIIPDKKLHDYICDISF